MDLKDFVSSKNIALYLKELPPVNDIDNKLFPSVKQLSTKIEFAKGSKNKPVAIRMSKFDAATKMRSVNAELNIKEKTIPFFKEGVGMNEETRRQIREYLLLNNMNLIEALTKQVYGEYAGLYAGCEIPPKAMRCQAIQRGYVNLTTADGDVVLDYEAPANHRLTLTGTDKWTDENADIIGDCERIREIMTKDQCGDPTTLLMTKNTFKNTIMKNKAITDHLRSNINAKSLILFKTDYLNFVNQEMELKIVFLDEGMSDPTYILEKGETPRKYYEDGLITFMSGNTLGRTIYGYTPEEYDMLYGSRKLDTTMVGNIAVTTMVKEDPVTVDTKFSQMVVPSFDRIDECFFLTAY